MKVKITQRPTGYISLGGAGLVVWPNEGEVIDLPDAMAEDMIVAGHVEKVAPAAKSEGKVEKRPAPEGKVEKRRKAD